MAETDNCSSAGGVGRGRSSGSSARSRGRGGVAGRGPRRAPPAPRKADGGARAPGGRSHDSRSTGLAASLAAARTAREPRPAKAQGQESPGLSPAAVSRGAEASMMTPAAKRTAATAEVDTATPPPQARKRPACSEESRSEERRSPGAGRVGMAAAHRLLFAGPASKHRGVQASQASPRTPPQAKRQKAAEAAEAAATPPRPVQKRPTASPQHLAGRRSSSPALVAAHKSQDDSVGRELALPAAPLLQGAPGRGSATGELRGLALVHVPLPLMTGADADEEGAAAPSSTASRRPKRHCIPPLQAWRNERLVYERLAGSSAPSVRGVLLNAAGEPGDVSAGVEAVLPIAGSARGGV